MNRSLRNLTVPLVAALLAACASSSSSTPGGTPDEPRVDRNLITREEIDDSPGSRNAYELIQSLRPQWLITRGITNLRQAAGEEDVVVYMDNARLGYSNELRRVPLGAVRYLQFFDARRATQRWGQGHIHGAILISTSDRQ
ncbi:MAG: hypothetical protein PVJ80_00085 [Gemmatimonadota bacterium]|jgi:hypothetical protein